MTKYDIIFVNDEDHINAVFKSVIKLAFSDKNLKTITINSSEELYDLLSRREIWARVWLVDLMMPNRSGVEIATIIRGQYGYQNTKVYALTALSEKTIQERYRPGELFDGRYNAVMPMYDILEEIITQDLNIQMPSDDEVVTDMSEYAALFDDQEAEDDTNARGNESNILVQDSELILDEEYSAPSENNVPLDDGEHDVIEFEAEDAFDLEQGDVEEVEQREDVVVSFQEDVVPVDNSVNVQEDDTVVITGDEQEPPDNDTSEETWYDDEFGGEYNGEVQVKQIVEHPMPVAPPKPTVEERPLQHVIPRRPQKVDERHPQKPTVNSAPKVFYVPIDRLTDSSAMDEDIENVQLDQDDGFFVPSWAIIMAVVYLVTFLAMVFVVKHPII